MWAFAIQIWGCVEPSQIRTTYKHSAINSTPGLSLQGPGTHPTIHYPCKDLKIETVSQIYSHHVRVLVQNYQYIQTLLFSRFHVKLSTMKKNHIGFYHRIVSFSRHSNEKKKNLIHVVCLIIYRL